MKMNLLHIIYCICQDTGLQKIDHVKKPAHINHITQDGCIGDSLLKIIIPFMYIMRAVEICIRIIPQLKVKRQVTLVALRV
jgi:hypothetical protein